MMKIKPEYLIYIIHCLIELQMCYLNVNKSVKLISNSSKIEHGLNYNNANNNENLAKDIDFFAFDDNLSRNDNKNVSDIMQSLDQDFDRHFNKNLSEEEKTINRDNKLNSFVFNGQGFDLKVEYIMSDGNRGKEAVALNKMIDRIAGSDDTDSEGLEDIDVTTQSIVVEEYSEESGPQLKKKTSDNWLKGYDRYNYGVIAIVVIIWLSIGVLVCLKCFPSNKTNGQVLDSDQTRLLEECDREDEEVLFSSDLSEERTLRMKSKRNRKLNELDRLKIGISLNAEELPIKVNYNSDIN